MNVLYICRVSAFQAAGNQIDVAKPIAETFFNVPAGGNHTIHISHASNPVAFEDIEIQPATNYRFSTRLNTFLSRKGDPLTPDCLLVFEKLIRSFVCYCISNTDARYPAIDALFETGERHLLLSSAMLSQPENPEDITASYRPYITAIKSKPFLLLAGISGTGKSRIVRELARACWDEGTEEYEAHKPSNFEMVQVKPNWHDSSELIGYVSRVSGEPVFIAGDFLKFVAKAWENPDIPHFLCLDEMNLAPVEQYFAEYLSVVESRKVNEDGKVVTDPIIKPARVSVNGVVELEKWYSKLIAELLVDCPDELAYGLKIQFEDKGICIPQNLIVVGTVNMDETTFSFSRKVLDRAMTIEMNEVDLRGGLDDRHEKIGKLTSEHLIGKAVEGVDVYKAYKDVCDKVIDYLEAVNEKLDGTPFKIAYRTRNEFLLYVVNNLPYDKNEDGDTYRKEFLLSRAVDEITSMKILSRIEGDESKVSKTFLNDLSDVIQKSLKDIFGWSYAEDWSEDTTKSVSLSKLKEMKNRLESGYTSFWS